MFMDMDTRAVFAPLTKWNAVVNDARRIPELVRTAFREALGGRPGPVHLDIPQDVLAAACEFADDEFDLAPARYRSIAGPRPAAACGERGGRTAARRAAAADRGRRRRGARRRRSTNCANSRGGCARRWCRRRWAWASWPATATTSSATAA